MDKKTFDFLKEQVQRGQDIVNQIKKLEANIERIVDVECVYFFNEEHSIFNSKDGNLTYQMKQAYIDAAEEEIKLLKQEFAEL